jgi:hypothetical protein
MACPGKKNESRKQKESIEFWSNSSIFKMSLFSENEKRNMVKTQEKELKKNSRKTLLLYERQEAPEKKFLEKDSQVTSPGQKSDYRDHCTLLYSYKREKDTRE